jgi:hypothetical protein
MNRNTTDSCGETEKLTESLMCINGYVLVLEISQLQTLPSMPLIFSLIELKSNFQKQQES